MIDYGKFKKGIVTFLDNEMINKMPTDSFVRLGTGVALGIIIERGDRLAAQYLQNPMLRGLGIVDENNNIDIDLLKKHLINNMKDNKFNINVPTLSKFTGPITISKEDVEKLYNYMMEG